MSENFKYNIIIPSSKLAPLEMQNEFGPIPPVLIPILGKITLKKITDSFGDQSAAFVGIEEGANLIKKYFKFFPDKQVKLIEVSKSKSISDTIEKMMEKEEILKKKPIILNFADTIIQDLDRHILGKDFIVFSQTKETERWTLFKERKSKITEISDKKYLTESSNWRTFTGVWGFSDPKAFFDLIKEENRNNKLKAFYNTIAKYSERHLMKFQETKKWVDVGHVDNYFAARKSEINTRFFNTIEVKEKTGSLTKTSIDNNKLRNEINWYISLPKELKYYIPTVFDFSLDYKKPFIEMEYYSYPSLDDCFIYAKFDLDTWENIFEKIFSIINVSSKYVFKDDEVTSDLMEMYYKKTLNRLHQIRKENRGLFNFGNSNSKKPLEELIDDLPEMINKFRLYETKNLQIIHGDLCFSNILYDNKHGIMKLIDPRGQFGRHSIYGDVYYDLAKISHSVLGLYDLITFGQFKLSENNEILWLNKEYQLSIGNIFKKHMKKTGFDLEKTRFIEALLFLSMLPLHNDKPQRQKALLIRGLDIIAELRMT